MTWHEWGAFKHKFWNFTFGVAGLILIIYYQPGAMTLFNVSIRVSKQQQAAHFAHNIGQILRCIERILLTQSRCNATVISMQQLPKWNFAPFLQNIAKMVYLWHKACKLTGNQPVLRWRRETSLDTKTTSTDKKGNMSYSGSQQSKYWDVFGKGSPPAPLCIRHNGNDNENPPFEIDHAGWAGAEGSVQCMIKGFGYQI